MWRAQGRRGIWLRVPIEKAAYIEPAVAAGFVFHHAEPSYIMCTHWLSLDPNKLPPNASHQVAAPTALHAHWKLLSACACKQQGYLQVGVGAFVLNERREVLVVQEKNGPLRGQARALLRGLLHRLAATCSVAPPAAL